MPTLISDRRVHTGPQTRTIVLAGRTIYILRSTDKVQSKKGRKQVERVQYESMKAIFEAQTRPPSKKFRNLHCQNYTKCTTS